MIRWDNQAPDQKPATFLHKSTFEVMHIPLVSQAVQMKFLQPARLAKLLDR